MLHGIVDKFFDDKGFGFIKYDGDKSIFVHITNIESKEPLQQGDEVDFEIGEGRKGPMAINVVRVAGASQEDDA